MALGTVDILTVLILLTQECGIPFHLLLSSLISSINVW